MLNIKKRNIVLLTLFFLVLCFVIHDLKELINFFKFDVNAQDLTADGVMLRNKFFASYYDLNILFPTLGVKTMQILLPIMFLVAMYYYNKNKNKVLKYAIGKSENVSKYLLKLKFKVAILPLIFYNSVILIYLIVSYVVTGWKLRPPGFKQTFFEGTILHFADDSAFWYIFLLIITSAIYIVASVLLLTTIIDYKYNYIVIFIVYFLIIYLGNDFILMYIRKTIHFTVSMNTSLGLRQNHELVLSYIYMAIVYIFFRITHKKEF